MDDINFPDISIIVPVYNVEDYIDVCLKSIEAQTFTDFEVILINDGSTDSSAEKCASWALKDNRFFCFNKKNEGVAAARNLGVQLSRGKYIAFVDPDDWLDPTYLEKLRKPLEETGAFFSECDLWRYDNRSGKKIYRSCGGRTGKPYSLCEHMKYGPTATYKSMSRRSLWEKYNIHMPNCAFESPAIYSLVLALSGGVKSVPEALYYYRRYRPDSLIESGYASKDGKPDNSLGVDAMRFLIDEFKRCGIFETYKNTIEGVVKYRLSDILAMQFHRKPESDFQELVANHRNFLQSTFPDGHNEQYITWGGYNLNRVLTHMNWLHDPSCRFNFSSIISICGEKGEQLSEFRHKNRYRQIMMERERSQSFWEVLSAVKPEYLFIDLIEERFDLIHTGNRYITKSDAYDGIIGENNRGLLIKRYSTECEELWRASAEEFTWRVRKAIPDIRLVIIESLLSETVGDIYNREYFQDLDNIRKTNTMLSGYYAYLESLWPKAIVIKPSNDPLYFTDSKFEYGAVPSHLNELLNQKLAEEIERRL